MTSVLEKTGFVTGDCMASEQGGGGGNGEGRGVVGSQGRREVVVDCLCGCGRGLIRPVEMGDGDWAALARFWEVGSGAEMHRWSSRGGGYKRGKSTAAVDKL